MAESEATAIPCSDHTVANHEEQRDSMINDTGHRKYVASFEPSKN